MFAHSDGSNGWLVSNRRVCKLVIARQPEPRSDSWQCFSWTLAKWWLSERQGAGYCASLHRPGGSIQPCEIDANENRLVMSSGHFCATLASFADSSLWSTRNTTVSYKMGSPRDFVLLVREDIQCRRATRDAASGRISGVFGN